MLNRSPFQTNCHSVTVNTFVHYYETKVSHNKHSQHNELQDKSTNAKKIDCAENKQITEKSSRIISFCPPTDLPA